MKRDFILFLVGFLALGCQEVVPKQRLGRAQSDWTAARVDVAVREVAKRLAQGDTGRARSVLEEALRGDVSDVRLHILLARVAIDQGRFAEAEAQVRQAAYVQPGDPAVDRIRGLLAESQGHWEAARLAYAEEATKSPDKLEPLLAQARVLHASARAKEAAVLLERAVRNRPPTVALFHAAGEALLAAGRPQEAAGVFRLALTLDYDHESSQELLALSLHLAGKHEEAYRELSKVVRPGSPAHLKLAVARSALVTGHLEPAIQYFTEYLETYPDDLDSRLELARSFLLAERLSDAAGAVNRVIELDPRSPEAHLLSGHIKSRTGDRVGAATSYLKAANLGADASLIEPFMELLRERESE